MLSKRLKIDYSEGSIEIQFDVKYNGQNTSIENIQIRSNFHETQLPIHATLEHQNEKWVLNGKYQVKRQGELISVKEQVNNKYASDIIVLLLKVKDEEIKMLDALSTAQNRALLIHYRSDDIIPKGLNKGFTLKDIYQYMPKYLEWCIKYWQEFEIDIIDFENLPNPTIPNPKPIPADNRLQFYPKIEYSVKGILDYIKKSGVTEEIKFSFSKDTLEILELKRKGTYTAPESIKSFPMSSEEIDQMLYTLEGTFYAIGKNCIEYIRFYTDKTVLNVTVSGVKPSNEILKWFNKENPKVSKGVYTTDISWLSNYFNDPSRFLGVKPNSNSKITFSIIDVHSGRKIEYSGELISK